MKPTPRSSAYPATAQVPRSVRPGALIEPLESRIAPAVIAAIHLSSSDVSDMVTPTFSDGHKTATFTDVDGDLVTVKTSRGTFGPENFTISALAGNVEGGGQLQTLSINAKEFARADITIMAKRGPLGGNGHVNVGHIDATGFDLGRVTVDGDLAQIDAGNATDPGVRDPHPGIVALRVASMGRLGATTEVAGADLASTVAGRIGAFSVTGDVVGVSLTLPVGGIHHVKIGGSIIGGGGKFSGSIFCQEGGIGLLRIGGSIVGGAGNSSGVVAASFIDQGAIRGSIVGSEGSGSGIVAVAGGHQDPRFPDRIAGFAIRSLRVGGDLTGGSGDQSGLLVASECVIQRVDIGGSIRGGTGPNSGGINSDLFVNSIRIRGDVVGNTGYGSGSITGEQLPAVAIGGSVFGGDGKYSGEIASGTLAGRIHIHGSLHGSAAGFSGILLGDTLRSLTIDGSLLGGSLRFNETIGTLAVHGDIVGTESDPVLVTAANFNGPDNSRYTAISRVIVDGRVEMTDVLAGYGADYGGPRLYNPSASIGRVVAGSWIASNLVAGAQDDSDAQRNADFGDGDDITPAGSHLARIGSVVIRHTALGLAESDRTFGIVAPRIGHLRVGQIHYPFHHGATNDLVGYEIGGGTGLFAREVPPPAL